MTGGCHPLDCLLPENRTENSIGLGFEEQNLKSCNFGVIHFQVFKNP